MKLIISQYVVIDSVRTIKNGQHVLSLESPESNTVADFYRRLPCEYPKFFKMDIVSKWALLGTQLLLTYDKNLIYNTLNKSRVAVVLATKDGCLDVDKKYRQTMDAIASPALFVYTLPNIMLGEIAIKHGFKGEQLCLVDEAQNYNEVCFWAKDLMERRGMEACICGWVNATGDSHDVSLFWIVKGNNGIELSPAAMQELYNRR